MKKIHSVPERKRKKLRIRQEKNPSARKESEPHYSKSAPRGSCLTSRKRVGARRKGEKKHRQLVELHNI